MKTNSPTHEEVTQRAQEIWQTRGRPGGCDTEIWLDAERQLSVNASAPNSPSATTGRGNGNSQSSVTAADPKAADLTPGHSIPSPNPAETATKVLQQIKEARAPQFPAKAALKMMPPESGKPLWKKPHSS